MSRITKFLEHYPLHWLVLSIYPTLALLALNIQEVDPRVALRPLLLALALGAALFLLLSLIFRNWRRGAIAASSILLLFYSYGHLYEFLQRASLLGFSAGRHRVLIPVFGVALVVGLILIAVRLRRLDIFTLTLNVGALFLLVFPISQILNYNRQVSRGDQASQDIFSAAEPLSVGEPNELPDIYFIVLDTYARADALQDIFGFDNTPFLDKLGEMGFYVADCSRSNYSNTQSSITAALNLDYIPGLYTSQPEADIDDPEVWLLLKRSLVRSQLESIGYRTVAFETGYEWSRLDDADIYLGMTNEPLGIQALDPFEAMLFRSTAGLILTDLQVLSFTDQTKEIQAGLDEINFPYQGFAERQLFILNQLLEVPSLPGPKFVFAHLLIPHVPYIFDAEGNIQDDPGYYGNKNAAPINKEYEQAGYTGEIQFINQRMLGILENILAESDQEPVIILMGDHGLKKSARLLILNAYYVPNEIDSVLYSSISPVNSFRMIFNEVFDTSYEILPDESFYVQDIYSPIPETAPDCLP